MSRFALDLRKLRLLGPSPKRYASPCSRRTRSALDFSICRSISLSKTRRHLAAADLALFERASSSVRFESVATAVLRSVRASSLHMICSHISNAFSLEIVFKFLPFFVSIVLHNIPVKADRPNRASAYLQRCYASRQKTGTCATARARYLPKRSGRVDGRAGERACRCE